jgi:hypothetical protein
MIPVQRRLTGFGLPLLVVAVAASCGDALGTGNHPEEWRGECRQGGRTYSGTLQGDQLWTAGRGPHRLDGDVLVSGVLRVERGAIICGLPGASLGAAGGILATGAAEQVIVFTAADPAQPWAGISMPGGFDYYRGAVSLFSHVLIEEAEIGFASWAPVRMEHVTVRQTASTGIAVGAGALHDVRVADACHAGPQCVAIGLGQYGGVQLVRVTVERSGGGGIASGWRSSHHFEDLRIIGSAGVGLALPIQDGDFNAYSFAGSIRITGGAAHPINMRLGAALRLLELPQAEDSLTGNAHDMVVARSDRMKLELRVGRKLGWRLLKSSFIPADTITLEMQPGSRLELSGYPFHARIRAIGTADEPVTIAGDAHIWLAGTDADTSVVRHARLSQIGLYARDAHVLQMDHIEAANTTLQLLAPGSHLRDATLRGGFTASGWPPANPAALVALGDRGELARVGIDESPWNGVVIDGDSVIVQRCSIARSAVDGIAVRGERRGAVVRDCNITQNDRYGISNDGPHAVDARENWWGSADGPVPDGANGVSGAVLYQPFRTEPAATAQGALQNRAPQ